MTKAKTFNVIIDNEVVVAVKDKPRRTFPSGWKGIVSKAEWAEIKERVAGRLFDAVEPEADRDKATEITEAANELLANAKAEAIKIVEAAQTEAVQIITTAQTEAAKVIEAATGSNGKTGTEDK